MRTPRLTRPTRGVQVTVAIGVAVGALTIAATTAGAAAPQRTSAPAAGAQLVRTRASLIRRGLLHRLPTTTSVPAAPKPTASTTRPTATPTPGGTPTVAPSASMPVLSGAVPADMPFAGLFGRTSVWDQVVSAAPVVASSGVMIKDLVGSITDRYGGVAAFNAHSFATSFYTATATTPKTDVAFDDCQHKGYTPAGLEGTGGQFSDVPIPADAVPQVGSDKELDIWSPATDQLWELWEAARTATGWSACWGGRLDHVSSAPGYFGGGFGASATGLSLAGGTLELSEVRAGTVPHALSLAIPDTAPWNDFSYPAQRSDGGDHAAGAIPEGTRLRLDPKIDVDAIPGLSPIARIVARTAQTYGFIVDDTSGAVAVTGESGVAEKDVTGVDPWTALEGGLPDYLILQGFPWKDLQVLPQNWGKPAA